VTEVKEAGPFERIVTIDIEGDVLEEAKSRAARKLAGEIKLKGFRPGRAPRQVVERAVGADTLQREAVEEALPALVADALREAELLPVVPPSIEEMRDTDDGVQVDVRITLWPRPESGPDPVGRKITVERPAVADEDVQRQIDMMRDQFAELDDVSREAFDGDYVLVDVTTSRDGGDVAEGSANDLLYEVGSNAFLPGMDEPLRGTAAGHIAEFTTTLPESIGEAGGTEVTARVLVKQVKAKRLPDLTDEWVDDVSEFETVDEMRSTLREQMAAMHVAQLRAELEHKTIQELRDELDVDLPEALVAAEMESTLHRFAHRLEQSGIDIQQYLQITGQSEDAFVDDLRSQAEANLKTRILLETYARTEGLTVEDADIDEAIGSLAAASQMDAGEYRAAVEKSGQGEALAGDILRRKAIDRLLEVVVPVDADGTEIEMPAPPAAGQEDGEATVADDDSDESGTVEPAEVDE